MRRVERIEKVNKGKQWLGEYPKKGKNAFSGLSQPVART
jgi:hypothetical protein